MTDKQMRFEALADFVEKLRSADGETGLELIEALQTNRYRIPEPEEIRNSTMLPDELGQNRYGVDMAYFRNVINRELNRPLVDFRPDELARVFARLSRTADKDVLNEPEFQQAAGAEPVYVIVNRERFSPKEEFVEIENSAGESVRIPSTPDAGGRRIGPLYASSQPPKAVPDGKYSDVLTPFLHMMEKELHANSGKGDREGWLSMTKDQCMLEIYYHAAKLQKAVKKSDIEGTKEYAADVANMCMMVVDICGDLTMPTPTDHPGPSTTACDDQEAPDE